MRTRVKICCISSEEEAQIAIEAGADALGLVGEMPSGPGVITDVLIAQIAKAVSPPTATFLLTSQTSATGVIDHHKKVNTTTIQLVDAPEMGSYDLIRSSLPAVKLVQVIHVIDEKSIQEAVEAANEVDAILLDSGNPNLKIKELGGTGRTHNWAISRKICEIIAKPVFLAGGLNPDNARKAIKDVKPFGLDICSGVRTQGRLDPEKLKRFFGEVNG